MARALGLANLLDHQVGGRRNLIINGAMQVAQRGTSETGITTADYYTVDRFKLDFSSLGTWTMDQADVTDLPGFAHSVKLTCTSAKTSLDAGNFGLIATLIEGQDLQHLKKGTSSAKSFTISFYVKSNKTGTYVLEVGDHDNAYRHISKSFTINASGTWEYKTITFEGDTTGVLDNDNDSGLGLVFWLAAGSTFSGDPLQTSWDSYNGTSRATGNVNLADQVDNYLQITGLQMELGETATPFEHRSYGEELALCQRYYEICAVMFNGDGVGAADFIIPLKVTKRTTPTATNTGTTGSYSYNWTFSSISSINNDMTVRGVSSSGAYRAHRYGITLDAEL